MTKTPFARWLKDKGLSLETFAGKTGFKYSTVTKWLYLERRPRDLYRERIAKLFPDCPLAK